MVIDFYTRRTLDADVAAIRAAHASQNLAIAHSFNQTEIGTWIEEPETAQHEDSSERLRRLATHLRHLAEDMRDLQAGCLAAMKSAEWR